MSAVGRGVTRLQRAALAAAAAGAAACVVGIFVRPQAFFEAYLFSYLFCLWIALGSLCLAMLFQVTGGRWGRATRTLLESGSSTLPLLAVLFIPILFGIHDLYPWSRAGAGSLRVVAEKRLYLNIPFFIVRAVFYFAVWIFFARLVRRWGRAEAGRGGPASKRLKALCSTGLVVYVLTMSFAGVDWIMSVDPTWYSTEFGMITVVGQTLAGIAFAIIVTGFLVRADHASEPVPVKAVNDLGNLLLAFVMLYAYMAFVQYLITWSGNLPAESGWFVDRKAGGWVWMERLLILGHFFIPFFFLLSRSAKRNLRVLSGVAALVIVMRFFEIFWSVIPTFRPHGFAITWLDVAAPLALVGGWLAFFLWRLKASGPLEPLDLYAVGD